MEGSGGSRRWSILCGFEALWSIDILVQFVRELFP